MPIPNLDLLSPRSLRSACRLLASGRGSALPVAGGTDLLPALKNRLRTPTALVDLADLPGLTGLSCSTRTGLRAGAMVSLRHLAADPRVRTLYPALSEAASQVASPQIQAMGTVGGNLCQDSCCIFYSRSSAQRIMLEACHKLGGSVCHAVRGSRDCWAVYSGDLAPILLVLGAELAVGGPAGVHTLPLWRFFSGDGRYPNVLEPGQVVTEIRVPRPRPGRGAAYLKLRLRQTIDYPLLAVAAVVERDGDTCREARVSVTGVERAPLLIDLASEGRLPDAGRPWGPDVADELAVLARSRAHPLSNVCEVVPAYRRQMVPVFVRRAVNAAADACGPVPRSGSRHSREAGLR